MSEHDNDTCPHLVRASLLEAENARLKADVERLRASSFVTAVPVEEYEKLKAEVERLKGCQMIDATYVVSPEDAERIRRRLKREKGEQP